MEGSSTKLELIPVATYRRVRYPTREEAKALGIDLYRVPDSLLRRFGRKAVTGATVVLLSTTASCQGARVMPCWESPLLHEDEAREIIVTRMAEEGVVFEMDVQNVFGALDVHLDGSDPTTGIGFEYYSIEDQAQCEALCCGDEWDRLNADLDEQEVYGRFVDSPSAPAIGFFDDGPAYDERSARNHLEQQVEEFIDWLVFHGRL